MYLSAFLHRDAFFEIANRWISNRFKPEDPLQITKIVTYDSLLAWETLLSFTDDLLGSLTRASVTKTPLSHKKELKDLICNTSHSKRERTKRLIAEYRRVPEFFYIGSPIVGYVYHDSPSNILSICRLKRVKRIAEKSSRYAKMLVIDRILKDAHEAARKGAYQTSPSNEPPHEFLMQAESELMGYIKAHGIELPVEPMTIKDVLGMKVIDHGYGEKGIESAISGLPGARIIEKERHTGRYNASHYVVELDVPIDSVTEKIRRNPHKTVHFTRRGLSAEHIYEDFESFISSGAETIQLDLILTSFDELVESEIGRSMHEIRIFQQRQQKGFLGNIPTNLEYIIEYLFAVGLSPVTQIDEIPIKIWGRYLPDTLSHEIRELFRMPEFSLING